MGKIHPGAQVQYFDIYPEDVEIVRPFLSAFDVTHGARRKRNKDEVAFFFLKPDPPISHALGLEKDREVLVVYSPFDELHARAIILHDEIVAQNKTRLDPIGTIVLCRATNTREAVRSILDSEPERAPIVAFSTHELPYLSAFDRLRAALVERLFVRDLFAFESPITTDSYFFGREAAVADYFDRFRSGQNSGLFGLRRIGKTSVLRALERRITDSQSGAFGYLDLRGPDLNRRPWWDLLNQAMESLLESVPVKSRSPRPNYTEATSPAQFRADVSKLLESAPSGRALLCLDEIENITFGISPVAHWQDGFLPFWQQMLSVHQGTKGAFAFIISGVNPHACEVPRIGKHDNPLFSTVKTTYLGCFDRQTTRAMVRRLGRMMGLSCEESLFDELHSEYGGHPFLIRQACSRLASEVHGRPAQLTRALWEANRAKIAMALEKNTRQILNVLEIWYPLEYELMEALARGDEKEFVEYAQAHAGFVDHVGGYGLVSDPAGNPKITIRLVQDHLAARGRRTLKELVHAAPASAGSVGDESWLEVLAEVSRRRNRVETKLRQLLADGMRMSQGKKAMETALAAVPSDRRSPLMTFGYEKMWQELFFLELRAILDKNWEAFQKVFSQDKATILGYLDQINRVQMRAMKRAGAAVEESTANLGPARLSTKRRKASHWPLISTHRN